MTSILAEIENLKEKILSMFALIEQEETRFVEERQRMALLDQEIANLEAEIARDEASLGD